MDINIVIDKTTWPLNSTPTELINISGNATFDLIDVLIKIGQLTKSPSSTGLNISDFWAWLRYFPAFPNHAELKTSFEWQDLDPHHKTVASDDFGIGFCTKALELAFGTNTRFIDTSHFIKKINPNAFKIVQKSKRGPSKLPDYVFQTPSGHYGVLECKGTQVSKTALRKAIKSGIPQKANLARGAKNLKHALVAGVFVPQQGSKEKGQILIVDPEFPNLTELFDNTDIDTLNMAFEECAFEQELSFLGFTQTASTLAGTSIENTSQIIKEDTEQSTKTLISTFENELKWIKQLFNDDSGNVLYKNTHQWSNQVTINEREYRGLRLTVSNDLNFIRQVIIENTTEFRGKRLNNNNKNKYIYKTSPDDFIFTTLTLLNTEIKLEFIP